MQNRFKTPLGFTLVEILVTMAFILIVTALGFSGYSGVNERITSQNQAEQFRGLIRDGATLAASRSRALTLGISGNQAMLRDGTTTLRRAQVNKIQTGLSGTQTIAFDSTGRVVLPGSVSSLSMVVNGRTQVLQVSGIGQTRWKP